MHLIASAIRLLRRPDVGLPAHRRGHDDGKVDQKHDRRNDAVQDGRVVGDVLVAHGPALHHAQAAVDDAEHDDCAA